MKKFVTKSIFISLPILIIIILMEILLRNIPNDYRYKKEYLDLHAAEIETLILGSSHASYAFNPQFFTSKAFNASHISQTLDYDVKIFNKYKAQFKNLKTVVLPISYFSLFYILKEGPEPWREKNYAIYYDIDGSNTLQGHSEVACHRINLNLGRIYFYYFRGISFMSCSSLGYGLREYFPKQNLEESGKIAAERHGNSNGKDIKKITEDFAAKMKLLRNFINECRAKNVKVIFLTPPAYSSYYENLNQKQLNETVQASTQLDEENDNVIYFNLLKDSRFKRDDFENADHLSEKGAEKLSKIINNKIIEWK